MPKMDLTDYVFIEKCPDCTVNLYSHKGGTPRPIKMPCNVARTKGEDGWKEDSFVCAWETVEEQLQSRTTESWEFLRGFMGQDSGHTAYDG